jgi:DNA-binding transcriptional regulator LsrR (DeoR family)
MARRGRGGRDDDAQAAAYLSAEHDLKQEDIAELLGNMTQSGVSRLLKHAEDRGWLEVRYRFTGFDRLSPERQTELKRLVEPKGLDAALASVTSATGVRVRSVRMFSSGSTSVSPSGFERRLRRFGRAACRHLAERLEQSALCGITWGGTLSHLVAALEAAPPKPFAGVTRFVPVCAEPLERGSNNDTSSHLVRRLQRVLQPRGDPPLSLTGVPALISRRFVGADAAGIRKFIDEAASYREIFTSRQPLVDRLDTLVTSVGRAGRAMGFIHEELLRAGSVPGNRLTNAKLERLVVGDIAGNLLGRSGLDESARREVDALNAMWTGINLGHLERIAVQADRQKRPGVIVVSIAANRADVIAAAVRRGLVNELVIDRDLALELTKTLSA